MRDHLKQAARAMRRILGLPDYETYCAHQRRYHPDAKPMDRGTFVRWCQERRYGRAGPTRCC